LSKIPHHERGKPLIGCLKEIRKDPIQYGMTVANANPPLVRVSIFGGDLYYTADAEMAHEILVSSIKFINRGTNYKSLEKLSGHGLFSSEGDDWKFKRKVMQPAMSHSHYDKYLEIFESIAEEFEHSWSEKVNQKVLMADEMSVFTIRAIGLSFFSFDIHEKYPDVIKDLFSLLRFINLRYYDWVKIPMWVPLSKHVKFKKTLAKLDEVIFELIKERRASGIRKDDMLDLLFDAEHTVTGKPLSDVQIRDELLTLIAAGFKTSAATLSWIWFQFSKNPDVLEKVRSEVKNVIGTEKINSRIIHELKYTRCVVNEALRMCPSAFAVSRNFNDDVTEFAGYRVKPGSRVITSIFGIHYNSNYWNNPFTFDPDRFLNDEKEFRRKGIFIPFGAGSRSCLGAEFAMLEMLTLIARLAPKFNPVCEVNYSPKMIAAIAIQFSEEMPMIMQKDN
jgi:cytochrome P450